MLTVTWISVSSIDVTGEAEAVNVDTDMTAARAAVSVKVCFMMVYGCL